MTRNLLSYVIGKRPYPAPLRQLTYLLRGRILLAEEIPVPAARRAPFVAPFQTNRAVATFSNFGHLGPSLKMLKICTAGFFAWTLPLCEGPASVVFNGVVPML